MGQNKVLKIFLYIFVIVMFFYIIIGINRIQNKPFSLEEIKKDAIALKATSFTNKDYDDDGYLMIEYNGKQYIQYGGLNSSFYYQCVDECIGYLVQDENTSSIPDGDNTDTRIYTLKDDPENHFLMEYYIGTTLMNHPLIYRDIATKGMDIDIPEFIVPFNYNYWN